MIKIHKLLLVLFLRGYSYFSWSPNATHQNIFIGSIYHPVNNNSNNTCDLLLERNLSFNLKIKSNNRKLIWVLKKIFFKPQLSWEKKSLLPQAFCLEILVSFSPRMNYFKYHNRYVFIIHNEMMFLFFFSNLAFHLLIIRGLSAPTVCYLQSAWKQQPEICPLLSCINKTQKL